MQNKYPGKCISCGERVAANAGILDKEDGRWVVLHTECATSSMRAGGKVPPPRVTLPDAKVPF